VDDEGAIDHGRFGLFDLFEQQKISLSLSGPSIGQTQRAENSLTLSLPYRRSNLGARVALLRRTYPPTWQCSARQQSVVYEAAKVYPLNGATQANTSGETRMNRISNLVYQFHSRICSHPFHPIDPWFLLPIP
jgi:hypothetical protein